MTMPPWGLKLPWDIIEQQASTFDISPTLVAATIMTESTGIPKAARLEPGWPFYFKPKEMAFSLGITEETEKSFQRHSWGLMQVMGEVARELGFRGFLPDLCEADVGILYGCKKIAQLSRKYQIQDDVIAGYNWGTPEKTPDGSYWNQSYVDKVNGFLYELKGVQLIE